MIYTGLVLILVPFNEKENPEKSYRKKYQKPVVCSYVYELVCVDDMFNKSSKYCLGKGSFCNFINSMIEESKFCTDIMKKHFNKNWLKNG